MNLKYLSCLLAINVLVGLVGCGTLDDNHSSNSPLSDNATKEEIPFCSRAFVDQYNEMTKQYSDSEFCANVSCIPKLELAKEKAENFKAQYEGHVCSAEKTIKTPFRSDLDRRETIIIDSSKEADDILMAISQKIARLSPTTE